jgi:hypothetical protein
MSLVLDQNAGRNLEFDEGGEISLFQDLSTRYREVLFSSLVTSFGLDAVLFRDDEANGHVDTIHNVVESAKDGKDPTFKSERHQATYASRGDYNPDEYHQNAAYIEKGKEWNAARDAGELRDAYTGKLIKPGEKYDRDHVVAAKTIHDDPRRALSSLDGVELANQDSNLQPTHRSINRSKKQDTAEAFLARLQKQREETLRQTTEIRAAMKDGTADAGAHKRLETLEAKLAVDEKSMREAAQIAERAQSRQHNSAYYMSRDFLGTTSLHAASAGFRMGLRQGLGVVMLELSAAVQEELPVVMLRWRETPAWQEKLDPRPVLEHIVAVLKNAWERVRGKFAHVLRELRDGFIAGALSEIVTTVINIFAGTAKRVMKMLREFWSAIISSLRILVHNPENLGPEEKLAAIMRVLSVAIGGIMQPIIAEAVDKLLMGALPLDFVREPLAAFAGAAVAGVVSVTLVYVIDNSPLVKDIIEVMRRAGAMTEAVYQQVAEMTGVAWGSLKHGVESITEAANSPAVNLVAFLTCPPLGVALYFNRRFNQNQAMLQRLDDGQQRQDVRLAELGSSIQTGFTSLERLVRENNLLLGCVLNGQEQQRQMLMEIRSEMRIGFEAVRQAIHEAKIETAELVAIRDLRVTLLQLQRGYQTCVAVLEQGKRPPDRDLEGVEKLADELDAHFMASFEAQPSGAPARLPLLSGMAFALGAWRDARTLLGDGLEACSPRAQTLAGLARKELVILTRDAGLWHLAEENAWLIEQYVLLRRALIAMLPAQAAFADDLAVGYIPNVPGYSLLAWNDGLQPARDVFMESAAEPPLETLPLHENANRQDWLKLAGLPWGTVIREIPVASLRERLGIPSDVPLGLSALKLLNNGAGMLESARAKALA